MGLPLAACLLLAAGTLVGCTSIPDEGPTTRAITDRDAPMPHVPNQAFAVIDLAPSVADRLSVLGSGAADPAVSIRALPATGVVGAIGAGDLLHVMLWAPDDTGSSVLQRASLELNARVDVDGTITVPFAGRLRVAGHRPAAVEQAIVALLDKQALSPQASVTVIEDQANSVIVAGEIVRPGRVQLSDTVRSLQDAIALAGGARRADYETEATIERGGIVLRTGLDKLGGPQDAIMLAPGDRVTLRWVQRRFYAFGAVNRPGEQLYTAATVSLTAALGKIAGLQDGRANPAGLFLFRRQPAALTQAMMTVPPAPGTDLGQVVYRVNLRDPASFFIMSSVKVQPDDIIYVSNAPLAELGKFASILAGISSVAATPRNFGAY